MLTTYEPDQNEVEGFQFSCLLLTLVISLPKSLNGCHGHMPNTRYIPQLYGILFTKLILGLSSASKLKMYTINIEQPQLVMHYFQTQYKMFQMLYTLLTYRVTYRVTYIAMLLNDYNIIYKK